MAVIVGDADNVLFFIVKCFKHQLHLNVRSGLILADNFLQDIHRRYGYFSSLAIWVNSWRDIGPDVFVAATKYNGIPMRDALHACGTLPARCISGRWMSVSKTEQHAQRFGGQGSGLMIHLEIDRTGVHAYVIFCYIHFHLQQSLTFAEVHAHESEFNMIMLSLCVGGTEQIFLSPPGHTKERRKTMLAIFTSAFASKKKADDAAAESAFAAAAAAAPPAGAPAAAPNANTTTEAADDPDAELNEMAAQRLKAGRYRATTIKTIEDPMWHILIDTMHQARSPLDHAHNYLSKQRTHKEVTNGGGTNMTRLVCGKAMSIFREFDHLLDECQDSVFADLPRTETVQYDLEASRQNKT